MCVWLLASVQQNFRLAENRQSDIENRIHCLIWLAAGWNGPQLIEPHDFVSNNASSIDPKGLSHAHGVDALRGKYETRISIPSKYFETFGVCSSAVMAVTAEPRFQMF